MPGSITVQSLCPITCYADNVAICASHINALRHNSWCAQNHRNCALCCTVDKQRSFVAIYCAEQNSLSLWGQSETVQNAAIVGNVSICCNQSRIGICANILCFATSKGCKVGSRSRLNDRQKMPGSITEAIPYRTYGIPS